MIGRASVWASRIMIWVHSISPANISRHHHSTWLVSVTGWNGRDHIVGGPGQLLNPSSSSLLLFYANFARFEAEHEVQLY